MKFVAITNTNGLSNAITTTKYSILTWLPKSLWEQFRRIANIYFLVVSVLMLIGTYAPSLYQTPLDAWSTVSTLVIVLMITSIKEGLEDIQRYKSDKTDNIAKVTLVTFDENGNLVERQIEKQYIKSGDIVKLSGKIDVPVDMILLMFLDSLHVVSQIHVSPSFAVHIASEIITGANKYG